MNPFLLAWFKVFVTVILAEPIDIPLPTNEEIGERCRYIRKPSWTRCSTTPSCGFGGAMVRVDISQCDYGQARLFCKCPPNANDSTVAEMLVHLMVNKPQRGVKPPQKPKPTISSDNYGGREVLIPGSIRLSDSYYAPSASKVAYRDNPGVREKYFGNF